jgi:hypothetical protein
MTTSKISALRYFGTGLAEADANVTAAQSIAGIDFVDARQICSPKIKKHYKRVSSSVGILSEKAGSQA